MKRRKFLTTGSLASASVALLALDACQPPAGDKTPASAGNKPGGAAADATEYLFAHAEKTISELQAEMAAGKLSAVALTQAYLDRIAAIDKAGPGLNAVIELNPDALSIAAALDAERKAGKTRGALHGIPVLVKDNIDTGDQMQTTAGSVAMEGHRAAKDAFVVAKLRLSGAVILGKTNLSEWANFRSSSSCSGWSSRGHQTLNPYLLSHNPCGSSSGSGVAVAANLCTVAVGTETDGSVTCPASVNGIVGLKPTVGLVSRQGIIPISATQDTAGPMARTVIDCALLLNAMTGVDAADPATQAAGEHIAADYSLACKPDALKGKRIGIEKGAPGKNQYMHRLLDTAKQWLVKAGAVVVELEWLDEADKAGREEFTVLLYEFKDGLNKYLATANAPIKDLAALIAFNRANEDRAMPFFKQETLEKAETTTGLSADAYKKAWQSCHIGVRRVLDRKMKEYALDAFGGLTMGPAAAIDRWYGDRWGDVSLTGPAATAGYPHITVPAGFVYGLPVGFSLFSGAWREAELLGMAYAFEQVSRARQEPAFKARFEPVG